MIIALPKKRNLRHHEFSRFPIYTPPQLSLYIRRLYEEVAEAYSRNEEPKFRDDLVSRPLIVELTEKYGSGKEVIDVGCGDGHISRLISPFVEKVVGVDISEAMLIQATQKSKFCSNVSFVKANFLNLKQSLSTQKFDVALGIYAFCCVKTRNGLDLAFNNIYRILRQGGIAIIQIPDENERLAESKSEWIQDLPPSFDRAGRVLIKRKLKTIDGNWVPVARYLHSREDYVKSIKKAGFRIIEIPDASASSKLVVKYPTLRHEAEVPSSLVFVLKK